MNPFVFSVGDLIAHPGRIRSVAVAGPVEIEADHARMIAPVTGELRLEGVTDGVFAAGPITTAAALTCNRCLTEYEYPVDLHFSQLFTRELDEDGYHLGKNDVLDIGDSLRDEIFLSLPLVPRCRADCLGLCATCGTDLNTDPCGGHVDAGATPFAVLRDIISE